jgi:alkane 1-monooxygenase
MKGKSSQGYYDGVLYGLALLQFGNLGLMASYVSQLSWDGSDNLLANLVNLVVIRFLVGTSSGTSGIVLAHELIHRPQTYLQILGRLLLCTVGYDHFVIAHMRGHHANLGLPEDIATARIGESFKTYWQRVYLGYWRYAWQSEQQRLAESPVDTVRLYAFKGTEPVEGLNQKLIKLWHNQVVQGIVLEAGLLLLILTIYGGLAAIMVIYQAWAAVRILEAVNYFQHWGLGKGEFGNSYGWVSRSWLSRYALLGLSHHIGHHEDENRQYYAVAYSEAGPNLPYGYFVMNLWVKLDNASYQKMALHELARFKRSQHKPKIIGKEVAITD